MVNLLLVDDHQLIRDLIKGMLASAKGIKIVGEAADGEEALRLARECRPQVVLMDLNMPGIGGLETTHKLLRFDPTMKILVITAQEDQLFPSRLLQAGAYGYLTKGATKEELLLAIKTVQSGQRYISPEIANQLALTHINNAENFIFSELTDRELEIMLMIVRGKNASEVAKILHLSTKTVNSYRYRMFEKLKVKSDVELTLLAIKEGVVAVQKTEIETT